MILKMISNGKVGKDFEKAIPRKGKYLKLMKKVISIISKIRSVQVTTNNEKPFPTVCLAGVRLGPIRDVAKALWQHL